MTSGCTGCGRRLYYNERVAHAQEFCFPCATVRGIDRICDRARWHHLRQCASLVEPWWAWTVYLDQALLWAVHDARGGRNRMTEPLRARVP